MPASPGEFDPACANASNTACSLLAPWDRAGDAATWSGQYYPAGYAADLWRPADPSAWYVLRFGMYASSKYVPSNTNNITPYNATYALNLLYTLESTLESENQVPFYGMSDRVWAISNGTVDVALPDLLQDAPFNLAPTDGDQGASYWIGKKVRLKGARMFAHAGASDTRAGPAGVVLFSQDYRGVLSGTCMKRKIVYTTNTIGDYYCVNPDCEFTRSGTYVGYNYLRTYCRSYTDFALECPVSAEPWLQKAFPSAYAAYAAVPNRYLTIQCPAYPWAANTMLGDEPGGGIKPPYPTCGLSTKSYISFDGYGTDSTCCFEQKVAFPSKLCSAQPDEVPPSCNRYLFRPYPDETGSWKCQDMVNCAGGGRLEWPFFKGAWLDTGTAAPCFQVPPIDDLVHRLPVINIKSIPRVLSPFDSNEKEYCTLDR